MAMIIPLATTRALDGPRSSSTERFMPQSVAYHFVLASESHVLTLPLAPAPIFGVKIHLFAANFSLDESLRPSSRLGPTPRRREGERSHRRRLKPYPGPAERGHARPVLCRRTRHLPSHGSRPREGGLPGQRGPSRGEGWERGGQQPTRGAFGPHGQVSRHSGERRH